MSGYLQRLAQRSGVRVGAAGPAAAAGSNPVLGSPLDQRTAPTDGLQIIDERVEVAPPRAAPGPASGGPRQPEANAPADSAGKRPRGALDSGVDARRPPAVEPAAMLLADRGEQRDWSAADPSVLSAAAPGPAAARRRSPVDRDEVWRDARRSSRQAASGAAAANGRDQSLPPASPLSGAGPFDTEAHRLAAAEPAADEPPTATESPGLVNQAVQWVMDDPHWSRQPQEAALAPGAEQTAAAAPAKDTARPRAAVRRALPVESRQASGALAGTMTEAAKDEAPGPELQLHIGRVSIEVHQAEPPVVARPPPAPPGAAGPSGGGAASSERRLRRLYLRGF